MAFLIRKLHTVFYMLGLSLGILMKGVLFLPMPFSEPKYSVIIETELFEREHNFLSITRNIPPTN